MEISPLILDGGAVRLEALTAEHTKPLAAAAADGQLWKSTVTTIPGEDGMDAYVATALDAQARRIELAFAIVQKSSGRVVGTTRFYAIEPIDRHVEIGYTWLAASAQRTRVNTETKLLLLTHAFEQWGCIRVAFVTDVLNQASRSALVRIGAVQEGILRNHMIMPDGRYRDSVCFSIIAAEWPDVKLRLAAKLQPSRP